MNKAEQLSLETVEDIWRTAEKLCARLQELGSESLILSINKEREVTTYRTSQEGKVFLQKNPGVIDHFKDYVCKTSEKVEIEEKKISDNIKTEGDISQVTPGPDVDESGDSSSTEILSDWNVQDDGNSSTDDYSSDEEKLFREEFQNTEYPDKVPKKKQYSCDICFREFSKLSNLKRHKKMHDRKKIYRCVMCDEGFNMYNELQQHLSCHDNVKSYKCEICNKLFRQKKSLQAHENKHKGIKPYGCKECGKCFWSSSNLTAHIRTHDVDKCYMCDLCGKTYNQHSEFVIHERSHRNERPFECEDCGKKFSGKSCLKKHQKIHSGIKTFLCVTCGKAFSRKDRLATHERVHTGDKPYMCPVCGKMYSDSSNLRIHKRTHTGQRFYCPTCGKGFVYKTGLNRHEKSHVFEKSRTSNKSSDANDLTEEIERRVEQKLQEPNVKINQSKTSESIDGDDTRIAISGISFSQNGLRMDTFSNNTHELLNRVQHCVPQLNEQQIINYHHMFGNQHHVNMRGFS